jgi:tRNA A37 methylthiotransferase MiaB
MLLPSLQDTPTSTVQEAVCAVHRTVFVETQGCQMNEADGELMLGLLAREGFQAVDSPEQADLVILNTCQIRELASDKAFSQLGRWGKLKRKNPELKIAMAGCVAQQVGHTVIYPAWCGRYLMKVNATSLPWINRKNAPPLIILMM